MLSSCLLIATLAGIVFGTPFAANEDDCQFRRKGHAPGTDPDTPEKFVENVVYQNISEAAITPEGYYLMFTSHLASISDTPTNKFLDMRALTSYDPEECAMFCDNIDRCHGFNTFIQRDPIQKPGRDCPNPNSTVNYYCTVWTSSVSQKQATNTGQKQFDFQIVIAGSNGYSKIPLETITTDDPSSSSTRFGNGTTTWTTTRSGEPPQPRTTTPLVIPIVEELVVKGTINIVEISYTGGAKPTSKTSSAGKSVFSVATMLEGLAMAIVSLL